MKIPFLDLKAPYLQHKEEIDAGIQAVIDRTAFAGGPFAAAFEEDFAAYCGTTAACGVGNGTDALWFALLALGIGPGDEVITAPNTFIATAEAISFCGATPVFADVDPRTYTMDPARLEAAITPKTKAVIPVHLFGQPADMDPILETACRHGLWVVEDACQAHGALYKGRKAGSMGAAGCFSFYPGKNLGAFGEGGAVVTNDEALADRVRRLRDHGQAKKYYHSAIGWNGRLDGIQAAVLQVKLKYLDAGNDARRAHADRYRERLAGVGQVVLPVEADAARHVYHIFAVQVDDRDRVLQAMGDRGIGCGIHYPVPVHLQEAYAHLGLAAGSFPVAERAASRFLSLPMFPELTAGQVDDVAAALTEIVAG